VHWSKESLACLIFVSHHFNLSTKPEDILCANQFVLILLDHIYVVVKTSFCRTQYWMPRHFHPQMSAGRSRFVGPSRGTTIYMGNASLAVASYVARIHAEGWAEAKLWILLADSGRHMQVCFPYAAEPGRITQWSGKTPAGSCKLGNFCIHSMKANGNLYKSGTPSASVQRPVF
jgi:hypothetical protein